MSDKTNDEKLRVLQERLAQIKLKQEDTPLLTREQRKDVIENITSENEVLKIDKKTFNLSFIKKLVIVISAAFGIFYGLTNFDLSVTNLISEESKENSPNTQLEYQLNLKGNNIAIVSTKSYITDEGTAKAMVNDLKLKGFKCDYIYLPENSNLTDVVYQVFIGPYENEEETNQWAKNLESEFNIITL